MKRIKYLIAEYTRLKRDTLAYKLKLRNRKIIVRCYKHLLHRVKQELGDYPYMYIRVTLPWSMQWLDAKEIEKYYSTLIDERMYKAMRLFKFKYYKEFDIRWVGKPKGRIVRGENMSLEEVTANECYLRISLKRP